MSKDNYDTPAKSYGAVITFPEGMTKEQCDELLRRMWKAGYCNAVARDTPPTSHEFIPEYGSPVWYIP